MPYKAMHFDYESMAENVASRLGEDWYVVDLNQQEFETNKRMINAIMFGPDEDPEDDEHEN